MEEVTFPVPCWPHFILRAHTVPVCSGGLIPLLGVRAKLHKTLADSCCTLPPMPPRAQLSDGGKQVSLHHMPQVSGAFWKHIKQQPSDAASRCLAHALGLYTMDGGRAEQVPWKEVLLCWTKLLVGMKCG